MDPLVLYVDDDEEDRLLLADAMSMVAPDYTIETVSDGAKALDYLQADDKSRPCLLVVDLNMPGMNGKELIQLIRVEHGIDVPIVAFTTSSNPLDRSECAKFGVDMITKPITFSELKETVQVLLSYCKAA